VSPTAGLLADTIRFSFVDGPGNRFVLFLQGCNFDCAACHNPRTIPLASKRARRVSVGEVLDEMRQVHRFLSGITVSGGEATLQRDFVHDLFTAIKNDVELDHLTTFLDTNGAAPRDTWDHLLPVTDGVMVDLKALDPELHRTLTGSTNDEVLASIRHLVARRKLHEVRLLLVPGVNDTTDQLRRTAEFLVSLDPSMRIKVIGFRHHGVRTPVSRWPEATADSQLRWRDVFVGAGVRQLELV
jgi:pyruvate formate lyase activating enzyme